MAFSITTPMGKDTYELSYVWTGNDGVSWTLNSDDAGKPKSGMMKKLNGSYALKADGASTAASSHAASTSSGG